MNLHAPNSRSTSLGSAPGESRQEAKENAVDMLGSFGYGVASPLVTLVLLISCIFVSRGLTPPSKRDSDR
jgi:hypothetical protein